MIALDTNVLVYAINADDPRHAGCRRFLTEALATHLVRAPWTVLYEFLRVVTHPRVLPSPLSTDEAWGFVQVLLDSPAFLPLAESDRHAAYAARALGARGVKGNLIHDAHIAAVLANHGITEIWSFDQDLRRFPGLTVKDPLSDW